MAPQYCCPRCRADLVRAGDGYTCTGCSSRYPVVCGIPDFRVMPDPYIGIEEDREKASRLADRCGSLDLEGLVRFYFEITPEVPDALARSFTARILETGPARARSCLALVETNAEARTRGGRVLEVGCGAGPFLPLLAARFSRVAATDVALRWLVVAAKRLQTLGLETPGLETAEPDTAGGEVELACACAEHLPYRDRSFDLAIAANVIEHVRDPRAMLDESLRLLGRNGLLVLTTPNRTSLAPDPHVRVWGIGFLPARWRDRAVRLVRSTPFENVHTRSYFELRALLSRAGFGRVAFFLPEVPAAELAQLGRLGRLAGGLYNRVRHWPGVKHFLYRFGPFFQVLASAASDPAEAVADGRHHSRSQASPAPRA